MGSIRSRGIIRPWGTWPGMPEEKLDELVEDAEIFPLPAVSRPIPSWHKDRQALTETNEEYRKTYDPGHIDVTPREYSMLTQKVRHAVVKYREKHPEVQSDGDALISILEEWIQLTTTGQMPTLTPARANTQLTGTGGIGIKKNKKTNKVESFKLSLPISMIKEIEEAEGKQITGIRLEGLNDKEDTLIFSVTSATDPKSIGYRKLSLLGRNVSVSILTDLKKVWPEFETKMALKGDYSIIWDQKSRRLRVSLMKI
jgi:hypothetical protein